jgi:predicted Rossmann-fold nucleotide-binding protein
MTDNNAQRRSKSYWLPVEDTELLLRDEMRAVRFALEYAKAELSLRDWGIRSQSLCSAVRKSPLRNRPRACCTRAEGTPVLERVRRHAPQTRWYELVREFARLVSERGGALSPDGRLRDNVIATGGGSGIMEAANRGVSDAGAPSIGFRISLPAEQEPNPYSTPELTFRFHYFAMRKMHLAMRANVLAAFPGGFGTMDELFELPTLQQTREAPPMPIVLFGRD